MDRAYTLYKKLQIFWEIFKVTWLIDKAVKAKYKIILAFLFKERDKLHIW